MPVRSMLEEIASRIGGGGNLAFGARPMAPHDPPEIRGTTDRLFGEVGNDALFGGSAICRRMRLGWESRRNSHSVPVFRKSAGARLATPLTTSRLPPTPIQKLVFKCGICSAIQYSWRGDPRATKSSSAPLWLILATTAAESLK